MLQWDASELGARGAGDADAAVAVVASRLARWLQGPAAGPRAKAGHAELARPDRSASSPAPSQLIKIVSSGLTETGCAKRGRRVDSKGGPRIEKCERWLFKK